MAIDSDAFLFGYPSGDEEVDSPVVIVKVNEKSIIDFARYIDTSFFPNLANGTLFQSFVLVNLPFRKSKFIANPDYKHFRIFTIEDDCAADWFAF